MKNRLMNWRAYLTRIELAHRKMESDVGKRAFGAKQVVPMPRQYYHIALLEAEKEISNLRQLLHQKN